MTEGKDRETHTQGGIAEREEVCYVKDSAHQYQYAWYGWSGEVWYRGVVIWGMVW